MNNFIKLHEKKEEKGTVSILKEKTKCEELINLDQYPSIGSKAKIIRYRLISD